MHLGNRVRDKTTEGGRRKAPPLGFFIEARTDSER
jgi:hypothetical protein